MAHLEVLGNLTDETLEGELPDQELGRPDWSALALEHARQNKETTHFWYRLISRRATVPGLYLWGFLTPPVVGCLRAALVATDDQLLATMREGKREHTLLAGSLSTGGFTSGLLGARHCI